VSAVGRFSVRLSAAVLPTEIRDRYREQWLGELRDAPGQGIRPTEIALGSLKFAATYIRPVLASGPLTAEGIAGRSRLAIALSLSAAILVVAQYASIVQFGGSVNDDFEFWIGGLLALIILYMIVAPLLALALLLATKAIPTRVRVAVLLLVAVIASPPLRWWIDGQISGPVANLYFTPGTIVYPVALVVVAVASVLIWREYRARESMPRTNDRSHRVTESVVGGLAVGAVVAASWVDAAAFWASRAPLEFGLELSQANRAAFENWVTLKVQFETSVTFVLIFWLMTGLLLAMAVGVSGAVGQARAGRTFLLTVGAVCLTLLSYVALMSLIQLTPSESSPTVSLDLVRLIAQCGVIVVVAGLVHQQLTPRTRASQARLDEDEFQNVEIPAPAR
jgi:hypothetical protein